MAEIDVDGDGELLGFGSEVLLRCGSFRKEGVTLFWGPEDKDPTI